MSVWSFNKYFTVIWTTKAPNSLFCSCSLRIIKQKKIVHISSGTARLLILGLHNQRLISAFIFYTILVSCKTGNGHMIMSTTLCLMYFTRRYISASDKAETFHRANQDTELFKRSCNQCCLELAKPWSFSRPDPVIYDASPHKPNWCVRIYV